ncbi:MAG: hypothetical protein M1829_002562 [Trizodia sp. TS-e1964]|nr:MAG: hypothetical protein M1829_002562 [Trizodia sp. TS-e1964]
MAGQKKKPSLKAAKAKKQPEKKQALKNTSSKRVAPKSAPRPGNPFAEDIPPAAILVEDDLEEDQASPISKPPELPNPKKPVLLP